MKLANDILSLEFDNATGSLVQIHDRRTGVRHLSSPSDGLLFRIVVPDEQKWLDRYAESHLAGKPHMATDGDSLTIRFTDAKLVTGESSGIDVEAVVRLPAGSDEAMFTITVKNNSPFLIHEVWYPRVGGWRGYAGPGKDTILRGDLCSTDPHKFRKTLAPNGYTLANHHRREFYGFAFGMPFPFLDISGGGRGLSYIHYPTKIRTGGAVVEDQNERRGDCRCAWSWVHQPFIQPGQTWISDPVGIAPNNGDWHATADRLRAWLDTWWRPADTPTRLRESIGYFNLYARDFFGLDVQPLSRMVRVARDLKAHGIEDFCIWDVIMSIYLRPDTGDFLEDAPARLAEFTRVLKEIRTLGIQVSTLVNYRLTTAKNRSWKERGEKQAMRSMHGAPRYEHWSKCRGSFGDFVTTHLDEGGACVCQADPEFQRWAVDLTERVLDFGFSSVFIDQAFETSVCFAKDHGHPIPGQGHEGANEWAAKAVAAIRKRDPEAYAIGENADIWTSRIIQLWWDWQWAGKRAEAFRYILPESLQSWIIDAYEHQHEIGKAFALGFLLSLNVKGLEKPLSDAPEFAARIKRLAALRKRTAAFTVHARFRDRQGLAVKSKSPTAAAVYTSPGKLGIIISDITDGPRGGGPVTLTLDARVHAGVELGTMVLHREDGSHRAIKSQRKGSRCSVTIRLKRWESVVLEVDKTE